MVGSSPGARGTGGCALRPPPKPASPGWYKHLAAGAKAMVLYDGGWWDVLVSKKLPTSAKSGESQKFEIEPVGYDLKRKVDVSVMRPSALSVFSNAARSVRFVLFFEL